MAETNGSPHEAEFDRLKELEDEETLCQVLLEIAEESSEAHVVRLSLAALTGTAIGHRYLTNHPVKI
jgi:hypothetical protein